MSLRIIILYVSHIMNWDWYVKNLHSQYITIELIKKMTFVVFNFFFNLGPFFIFLNFEFWFLSFKIITPNFFTVSPHLFLVLVLSSWQSKPPFMGFYNTKLSLEISEILENDNLDT